MSIDPIERIVFSEFYDLMGKPPTRKKYKCLRCGAPTIGTRTCNKCRKFIDGQSKLAQDDEGLWIG